MAELKLNNLVDLLLVVGSDTSSGLTLDRSSKTHPRFRNNNSVGYTSRGTRRESQRLSSTSSDIQSSSNGLAGQKATFDGSSIEEEEDDILLQLTDPRADYKAKVLQVFSSKLASYPHRGEDEQLTGYPHQLLTSAVHSLYRGSSGGEREEDDEFNEELPMFSQRNRRLSHQALRRTASISSGAGAHSLYDGGPRRHSISSLGLSAGGGASTKLFKRPSLAGRGGASPNVALYKNKTPEMPLSTEQIGAICNLCYPSGFRCYELSNKPSILTYVLTDIEGNRFYAVALTFYKKYTATAVGEHCGNGDDNCTVDNTPSYKLTDPEARSTSESSANENSSVDVYLPTCVVLVTSYPYYNTLHKCLSEFYSAIQPNFTGFDEQVKQLASAITNIPVPPSGGELSLTFKTYLCHQVQRHGITVTVHPAAHPSRPITDLNMHILFSLLRPSVICTIISALLQEQRLVFVSSRYSLLTLTQEILMHMIYPFRWQSMYVPVLNAAMITLLEAPGYFVMGCHSDFLPTTQLVEGLVVVDLDKGRLVPSETKEYADLPLKAASPFCTKVVDTEMEFDLSVSGEVYQNLFKAKEEFQMKVNREICSISLSLMVDLIGDVHDHIITEQKFFDKTAFLSCQSSEDQQFYTNMLETTMFKAFLREILSESGSEIWTSKATERQRKNSSRPGSRTSRSIQSREHKRSLVAIQYENSCKTFNLPYMLNLAEFQEDSVLNLKAFIEIPSGNKLSKAASLYVMGSINLHRDQIVDALNNFGDLYMKDSALFPEEAIITELTNRDHPGDIVKDVRSIHSKLYADLLQSSRSKKKTYCTDVKVDLESLPKAAVNEAEFHKYAERLDLAVGRDAITRLYQALTLGTECEIEAEQIKIFYECWKDNEAECRDMEAALRSKSNEDDFTDTTVLKVSSSLVRTDYGNGTVILTSRALLLLKTGCQVESVKEIARLSNISKLQVENVKIVLKPVLCLRVYTGSSIKPVNIFLESESKTWQILLNELIGGKIISTNIRDLFLMQQAEQCTLLLDALILSSKSSNHQFRHSKDIDKAVDFLSYYSKEETKQKLLISCDATRDTLLYRLNPNADELDSVTVECIIYVPGVNNSNNSNQGNSLSRSSTLNLRSLSNETLSPTVWCGLANGKIRIFDAASWRLYPRYVQATDRVVCLAYSGTRIWAGSFDTHIYVTENNPSALEFQTLCHHKDYVVDLQDDPSSPECIFSASIDATILQWNSNRLEVIREIKCPFSTLTSFRVISHDEIWCCCKDSLVRMDISGNSTSLLYYINESDTRVNFDSFCIIQDDIWAGCADIGRVILWSKTDEVRKAILPLDARGISHVVPIGGSLYLGCKTNFSSNEQTASKSKLYIIDVHKYAVVEELSAHNDSIRCMFAVGDQYLLTGSASREGKIAIWKHHPITEESGV